MECEFAKSYLHARDPSIVAYNRAVLSKVRMNLDPVLGMSSENSDGFETERNKTEDKCINVYLRIRNNNKQYDDIYEVNGPENTLICKKLGECMKKNYTFTKIFNPEITQLEIFNYVAKPKLLSFINGTNSSLFSYGASGSGKTFTIVGTPEEPGLIPRSIEYIFRSIFKRIKRIPEEIPLPNGFIKKISNEMGRELDEKKSFLLNSIFSEQSAHIKTYQQIQKRLSSEPVAQIEDNPNVSLSLWVSFAEIYNETIYDLLVQPGPRGKSRTKLDLGKIKDENTYIKNLNVVNVTNGLEAYQILQYGLHNLNYAATAINSHSSRSHCIFTIKLVQTSNINSDVYVSNFTFCDLAGSERLKKTLNCGDRLKESNNINTSLLVLGRCIENIRKCQQNKESRTTIPFRESKLTRLFQRALMGYEKIEMIVNINPTKDMFDETIHVLNFSAIAKTITIEEPPKAIRKKNRFSQLLENESEHNLLNAKESKLARLYRENKELKEELKRKSTNTAESQREYDRLCEAYEKLIDERDSIVNNFNETLDEEKQRVINLYKGLIEKIEKRYEKEIKSLKEMYETKLIKQPEVISISSSSSSEESSSETENEEEGYSIKSLRALPRKDLLKKIIEYKKFETTLLEKNKNLETQLNHVKEENQRIKDEVDRTTKHSPENELDTDNTINDVSDDNKELEKCSKAELISKHRELESLLEEAKEECLNLLEENERYMKLYKQATRKYLEIKEDCKNVTFT